MQDRILLVDDDREIRNILSIYLRNNGCDVVTAENGQQALEMMDDSFDLVLLDVMMPVMDGMEACAKIREKHSVPIIFLSAKGADMDRISGLMTGADDYITKPFNPMEVVARIKANIRRYKVLGGKSSSVQKTEQTLDKISIHNIEIYMDAHTVMKNGEVLKLTRSEFEILKLLVKNRGIVLNADQIYDRIWDERHSFSSSNSIVVHIKNLRDKIEDDPKNPKIIINVWGVGYKIEK